VSSTLFTQFESYMKDRVCQATWKKCYLPYLAKASGESLTIDNFNDRLKQVCESYPPRSRSRQVAKTVARKMNEMLSTETPFELEIISSAYGTQDVKIEPLPSDNDIISAYRLIPNPLWRNAYALMAVYGIRNHEVFRCKIVKSNDSVLRCHVEENSKTGKRIAFPYPHEWVSLFNISEDMPLPEVNLSQSNQLLGQRVGAQFCRYGIEFRPYALRRSFACRAIALGNDFLIAKSLGHSVEVLNKIYRRHIDPSRLDELSRQLFCSLA